MIKEPSEIELLRRTAEHTDRVIEKVIPKIVSGITMRELRLEIELLGRRMGAEGVSFPPVAGFIRPGSQPTGSIYGYEMDEGLEPGTTIFFDLGFVLDGYSSDWGRSVYWGKAGSEVKEAYAALQRAVVETVAKMKPNGMRVCDIFPSIEASLDGAGFGDFLRARLSTGEAGHQIGIEVHEDPWLVPENEHPIQKGMVMCIEPKLWRDGDYYLRVEDMVVVNDDGAEFLTNFDRELFEIDD
jgi:Xaa-Pro aminopeptidase